MARKFNPAKLNKNNSQEKEMRIKKIAKDMDDYLASEDYLLFLDEAFENAPELFDKYPRIKEDYLSKSIDSNSTFYKVVNLHFNSSVKEKNIDSTITWKPIRCNTSEYLENFRKSLSKQILSKTFIETISRDSKKITIITEEKENNQNMNIYDQEWEDYLSPEFPSQKIYSKKSKPLYS